MHGQIPRGICFWLILQIGPHTVIRIVDIVAIPVHIAVIVDIRGIVTVIARRAQPVSILSHLFSRSLLIGSCPAVNQTFQLGRFFRNLLILLWQYTLLRSGKHCDVTKHIQCCVCLSLIIASLFPTFHVSFDDSDPIRPIKMFDHVQHQILDSRDERESKFFGRMICN